MEQIVKTIFNVLFRLVLLFAGLVFMASLLLAALLMLGLWLLQALWARLTGQPVRAWTFRVNPQATWNRFYRPSGSSRSNARNDSDVVDVEIKEIKDVKPRDE